MIWSVLGFRDLKALKVNKSNKGRGRKREDRKENHGAGLIGGLVIQAEQLERW